MEIQEIELLPRSAFKALSRVEQDEYLQTLARDERQGADVSAAPLPEEALDRLRRFYRRRTFADLKREVIADTGLAKRLARADRCREWRNAAQDDRLRNCARGAETTA